MKGTQFSHELDSRSSTRREFGKLALAGTAGIAGLARSEKVNSKQQPSIRPIAGDPIADMPANAFRLHENWRVQSSKLVSAAGETLSKPGVETSDWHTATVPTTVLTCLVANGIYPDPYVGLGNMRIPDANDSFNTRYGLSEYSHLPDRSNPWSKPYWYRTEFAVPAQFSGKIIWLNFAGINYRAGVWLNGHHIASAKQMVGMFRRFRFDVTSYMQPGESACMAVQVYPLDIPGDPVYAQVELMGGFGPNGGDGEISRNVTDTGSIGWDWVPAARDRNMGIWQDVWLDASGPVAIRDPFVSAKLQLPQIDAADLSVRFALESASTTNTDVYVRIRIEPGNFQAADHTIELETSIKVPPQAKLDVTLRPEQFPQLILRSPRLWWPINYGRANLYRLSIEASVNGVKSCEAESTVGIREITSTIFPTGGRAFYVNGRKIRITGGAWIPDFLLNWDAQRYRDEARLIALGNHTMVRVNGCSITAPDVFYAACDRLGVLVWQEFWRTSIAAGWSPKRCDPNVFLDCAKDAIRRVRHHPSLVLWGASNEAYPQRDIYEPLTELVDELDGTRLLLPDSGGKDPEWAKVKSEVYTGGPWKWVPEKEYFDMYAQQREFGFRDEVGLPSMPDMQTIRKSIPDYDRPSSYNTAYFPANITMSYHDLDDRSSHDAMLQRFGRPAGIAEYAWRGQIINTDSYRAIFEAMNKNFHRNGGTLIWKTNAAWPSFMWQVYDWYLRPNAGYYSMKRACCPIHVQFNEDDGSVSVISTRDRAQQNLIVQIDLFESDGGLVWQQRKTIDVEPDRSVPVTTLPAELVANPSLRFLRLLLLGSDRRQIDRNVYWIARDKNVEALNRLTPVELKMEVLEYSAVGEEALLRIAVSNPSKHPALLINPSVLKGAEGAEVLPTFWSDNYIHLLPGEKQQLAARFRSSLLGESVPHLACEGWNVTPGLIDLASKRRVPLSCEIRAFEGMNGGARSQLFSVVLRQLNSRGERLTTWPIALKSGDDILRTFRVSLSGNKDRQIQVSIDFWSAGDFTVAVAGRRLPVKVRADGCYLDPLTFQTFARASASGSAGSSSPAYAIDGLARTKWISSSQVPQWLAVDLGAPFKISKVALSWGANFATEYRVQTSLDSLTWNDVWNELNGHGGEERQSFPATEARHIRILGTKSLSASGIEILSISVE